MNSNISFGIKTAPMHTTYEAMLSVWMEADANPAFEHAWLFDHFSPIHSNVDGPCLEGWTTLAAYAAQTSRLRVGLMVTGNTYRHPAVLAHMAASVDIISNGRLDLGIGAGWNEYEHESMGIPLYSPAERIRRLGETCVILKSLFTQHLTTFHGNYYQLNEARCEPKPVQHPHPPLVIGGGGEQLTLRVVAEHADVWNYPNPRGTPEEFKHKLGVLERHCNAIGRDPSTIRVSVQPMVAYDNLEATRQSIQQLVEAGATHIVLNLRPPYSDGIISRLAVEVVERVLTG
jgi:F420-dependent oxidoreductase-like protein